MSKKRFKSLIGLSLGVALAGCASHRAPEAIMASTDDGDAIASDLARKPQAVSPTDACVDDLAKFFEQRSVPNTPIARLTRGYYDSVDQETLRARLAAKQDFLDEINIFLNASSDDSIPKGLENEGGTFWSGLMKALTQGTKAPDPSFLALLKSRPELMKAYRASLSAMELVRTSTQVAGTVFKLVSSPLRATAFAGLEPGLVKRLVAPLGHGGLGLVNFFSPFPVLKVRTPIARVFEKQFMNPRYVLEAAERSLLKEAGLLEAFELRGEFFQKYPRWQAFRKWVRYTRDAAIFTTYAYTVNHIVQQNMGGIITADEYISNPAYTPDENEIQIVTDMGPTPHIFMVIGRKAYSFGYEELEIKPIDTYLFRSFYWDATRIQELINDPNAPADIWDVLAQVPRSAEIVTLELTTDERNRVKRSLELQKGKKYQRLTGINDCATMIRRTLEENTSIRIPRIFDASPTGVMLHLSMLKTLGSPKVKSVFQVTIQHPEEKKLAIIRNAYLNLIEARFFLAASPYYEFYKTQFLMENSDDHVMWSDKNRNSLLEVLKLEAQDLGPAQATFDKLGEQIKSSKLPRGVLEAQIDQLAEEQEKSSQGVINDPDADFEALMRARYRIAYVESLRSRLKSQLKR